MPYLGNSKFVLIRGLKKISVYQWFKKSRRNFCGKVEESIKGVVIFTLLFCPKNTILKYDKLDEKANF